jgi:beta-lactamase superfamily II metal-dependent hydrolase
VKAARFLRVVVLLGLVLSIAPHRGSAEPFSKWFGPGSRPVAVEFLDVGQGDSILIRSPEGKTALIDAGPTRDAAARWLRSKGISAIDIVIISHHHSDHYGGMNQVVREFKPRYFMATGSPHATKGYLKLLETVKAEGIVAVQPTGKPRKIELGSVTMTVLPQPPPSGDEENNNSIGVRLQYGEFSVLLTGDSETDERRWWISHSPDLLRDCTILKLAHHGSQNGTDQRWLDVVQPELAVASLGEGNDYGHPHPETLLLVRSNQVPLLRTDQRGTITILSNGKTWNLVSPGLARRKPRDGDAVAATSSDRPRTSFARSARSQPVRR